MIRADPGFLAPQVEHRPMAWAWPATGWWTLALIVAGSILWAALGREGGLAGLAVGLLFLLPVGIGGFLFYRAAARRTVAGLVGANARRERMHFIRTSAHRIEVHTAQGRFVWRPGDVAVERTTDGWLLQNRWWSATCAHGAMDDVDRRRLQAWQRP